MWALAPHWEVLPWGKGKGVWYTGSDATWDLHNLYLSACFESQLHFLSSFLLLCTLGGSSDGLHTLGFLPCIGEAQMDGIYSHLESELVDE